MSTEGNTENVPSSKEVSTWKLPDGIEEHIYSGLVKGTVGVVAGAAVGAIMFKSGKGWRTASMAAGVGVAMGSTAERIMTDTKQ